jgi:glycosyltransferase involved in cell wall biosynthesis
MKDKMKVLMVVFNLSVANGVSSYVMNYYRNLDHKKVAMDFVIYQDVDTPYYAEIEKNGDRIFKVPSIKNIKEHMAFSKNIIRNGQYDIVHDNILILSYFLMHYAKNYNVPVRILHSHNSRLGETKYKELRNKMFMPLLLAQVNTYFACSDLAAKGMFGNAAYTFIPNVISSERINYDETIRCAVRKDFDVDNKLVIGTVGRLAYQKNPFYALDVIAELHKINPNIQYWWIGNGPLENEVKAHAKKLGLDDAVKFLGRRSDVEKLYPAMDIFFLPSKFEGLPVTGIEAQAVGLPCLVSDTVTKEFVFTDLVQFFPLYESPIKTAKMLNLINIETEKRNKYKDVLEKSKFADQRAGMNLLDIYHKLYRSYHA